MTDEKQALEKLPVLRDDPLFVEGESLDPSQDAFNHEAYANAIHNILTENEPPLSIGLFGPWGIGKSTVINILFKLISNAKESKLKPIYFNAWKYSGDSFRRQLLIEVAKQVSLQNRRRVATGQALRRALAGICASFRRGCPRSVYRTCSRDYGRPRVPTGQPRPCQSARPISRRAGSF